MVPGQELETLIAALLPIYTPKQPFPTTQPGPALTAGAGGKN